jgi:hypothetical protein
MGVSKNALTRLLVSGAMVYAIVAQAGTTKAQQTPTVVRQSEVTAIDILLEPDATMLLFDFSGNGSELRGLVSYRF